MTNSTTTAASLLTPEQVGELLTLPVTTNSIAGQVSTTVTIGSGTFRLPVATADPAVGWVAEGAEIDIDQGAYDQLDITPGKLAGITLVTSELADDSSPEATEVVGAGLSRDIATKLDAAFFGSNGGNAVQPAGLADLTGVTEVVAPGTWANVDPFTSAIFGAQVAGANVAAFVAHPTDALALAQLKESDGSNRPLLQPDPTQPGRRLIAGVPLLTSTAVTAGDVWAIDPTRSYLVIRDDADIIADRSAFFSSDRVALRAKMRVGFGWPHPAGIVRIRRTP